MVKCSSLGVNLGIHFSSFQADRWENVQFESKPSNETLQINHLGKTSPVLRFSTHISGFSKDIEGKMFIFWVNLGI